MFTLTLNDSKSLTALIEAVKDIVNEININIELDGRIWFQVRLIS